MYKGRFFSGVHAPQNPLGNDRLCIDKPPFNKTLDPPLVRKFPKVRIFQQDQLQDFKSKFACNNLTQVVHYIHSLDEYKSFLHTLTETNFTVYRIDIQSGIAQVKECIDISSALHVKLSYEGCPVPLPEYISSSKGSKITSLDILINLPNYIRKAVTTSNVSIDVIKELVKLSYYRIKGVPKYSPQTLRFALQLRYTSHGAYAFLKQYMTLPSERLLRDLKLKSLDSGKCMSKLREEGLIGNDVVLLLDEMHLQQQVQYNGRDIIGCDKDLLMYKCILCFMVVSITKSIPFILKAIPLVKLTSEIVGDGILNCLEVLNRSNFSSRAVISDNHQTNIATFKRLMKTYPIANKNYCMSNPTTSRVIYLFFDTVHLLKNIRVNLLSKRFFQIPDLEIRLLDSIHSIPSGFVNWSSLHKSHNLDIELDLHLRKAPALTYSALHPGNNKQSVRLALVIFDVKTTTAMRLYLHNIDHTTPLFLNLYSLGGW